MNTTDDFGRATPDPAQAPHQDLGINNAWPRLPRQVPVTPRYQQRSVTNQSNDHLNPLFKYILEAHKQAPIRSNECADATNMSMYERGIIQPQDL